MSKHGVPVRSEGAKSLAGRTRGICDPVDKPPPRAAAAALPGGLPLNNRVAAEFCLDGTALDREAATNGEVDAAAYTETHLSQVRKRHVQGGRRMGAPCSAKRTFNNLFQFWGSGFTRS